MNAKIISNEPIKEIYRVEYIYGNRGREAIWTDITRDEAMRDAQAIADVLNWSVELFARRADVVDSEFETIAYFKRPIAAPTEPGAARKFFAQRLIAMARVISGKILHRAQWKGKK